MNNAFAAVVIFMAGVGRSPGRASALHNLANDGGGGRHDGAETGMTVSNCIFGGTLSFGSFFGCGAARRSVAALFWDVYLL